jgi:putative flippase GtrA
LSAGGSAGRPARNLVGLYQRFRQLIHEGAKFGIVGLTGVVVVIVGADLLHYSLDLEKFTSVTVATVLATVVTFLGNRYWSFKNRQGAGARNESVTFFVLNGVGLLIQYACLGLVSDLIGLQGRLWYNVANLLGIGLGTLFRFWSYRKWVWVPPEVALARLRRGRHRKGRAVAVPEPMRAEPTRPERTRPEPTRPERTRPEPARAASARADAAAGVPAHRGARISQASSNGSRPRHGSAVRSAPQGPWPPAHSS